jgi:hypothetical protein
MGNNTTIGTVQVVLSASHEKMTRAFGEASKQVAAFKNTVVGLVGAWAGVATARAAVAFIKHNMDVADALEDQAEQIGVTVHALGGLQLAAAQTGMSAEKFGTSMGKMQQAMVAVAHGSPEIEAALRAIGLTADELKGKGADEQLGIIADRFAATGDASLAAATAVKLFGKGGLEMIPMLNGGAAGLAEAAKAADELGISLSGIEIGQITEAKTVLAQVEAVILSVGLRVTEELSPYITELGHYFLNAAREAGGFRSQIAAFVEGAVHGAVAVYDTWMRLREVWTAVRIGVMWMADKVLAVANGFVQAGQMMSNTWKASWELVKAFGVSAIEGIKGGFYGLKLGILTILDGIGQATSALIMKMADAAGYVSEDLQFKLSSASVALSDTTKAMRDQASADFKVSTASMMAAAKETGQAVLNLGKAMTTIPEGSAAINEMRQNLQDNSRLEVQRLNDLDEQRLANVGKVEAAIIEIKSQAAKRAEEIEKGKQARIAAARNVTDAETIEAERKKHVAIAGETATFFGNIESMTAAGAEKNKALFYTNKAAAMAQAIINAWMAYSNTLASPALISNPLMAQGFASAQLAAGLVAAANIAGQSPPGRANGGPVGAGGLYEVNERGPEMLTVGDKSFLMMGGRSGHVTPGGPGGGSPKVEVHVYTPPGMQARTEQGTGEGGAPRVDVIIEQVANRVAGDIASGVGPVSRTLQSTYGLNRSRGSSR